MVKSNSKFIVRLGLTLFIITTVVALMLAGVNALTADIIEQHTLEAKAAAMEEVMPGYAPEDDAYSKDGCLVTPMMKDGAIGGFCVEVTHAGFGGDIDMVVGIKLSGSKLTVSGVSIISMSETAGLGTKAGEPSFLGQFKGLTNNISHTGGDNNVSAISGATVTSRAVIDGVNRALDAAADVLGRNYQ